MCNEEMHDERRGAGTYNILTENLRRYQQISERRHGAGELSVACVMSSENINGAPGQSVRLLAKNLKIKKIRFRPLRPLGRASSWDEPILCEGLHHYLTPLEILENGFKPLKSCGMGQNLFIEPDGNVFPCYAWHPPHAMLGNASKGLSSVLGSELFRSLSQSTVDTIEKCRECEFRYLCGGACRAWGNKKNQQDLNAAPPNCDYLRMRAENLVKAARKYLLYN